MGGGSTARVDLGGLAELFHEALHSPTCRLRREECLHEIPGQVGACEQEHERTPKRAARRCAEREPRVSRQLLEAGGRVDLRLAHGFDEEATPKGAA